MLSAANLEPATLAAINVRLEEVGQCVCSCEALGRQANGLVEAEHHNVENKPCRE